jgi:hypothetical protein
LSFQRFLKSVLSNICFIRALDESGIFISSLEDASSRPRNTFRSAFIWLLKRVHLRHINRWVCRSKRFASGSGTSIFADNDSEASWQVIINFIIYPCMLELPVVPSEDDICAGNNVECGMNLLQCPLIFILRKWWKAFFQETILQ